MRRNQFAIRKNTHAKESIKIKMTIKFCLDCGAQLNSNVEIIFHNCNADEALDLEDILDNL